MVLNGVNYKHFTCSSGSSRTLTRKHEHEKLGVNNIGVWSINFNVNKMKWLCYILTYQEHQFLVPQPGNKQFKVVYWKILNLLTSLLKQLHRDPTWQTHNIAFPVDRVKRSMYYLRSPVADFRNTVTKAKLRVIDYCDFRKTSIWASEVHLLCIFGPHSGISGLVMESLYAQVFIDKYAENNGFFSMD